MRNYMYWAEPTPIDWVFVILPPVLLIYFAYSIWSDNRARKKKEEEDEAALEAAFIKWLEEPTDENSQRINEILEGVKCGR